MRSRARSESPCASYWRTRPDSTRSTNRVDRELVADLDRLAVVLARQKPAWEPGTRQAYHAITLGFYESELLRRIDPQHRSLGQFFQDEIATPLGLDVYIRLPEDIPNVPPGDDGAVLRWSEMVLRLPAAPADRRDQSALEDLRALRGSELPHDEPHVYARNLEVPSGGAVGTARAIARAYSVFATGGRELGLRAGDARAAGGAGDSSDARVLRRVHEGDGAVLARLHEVDARLAVRRRRVRTGRPERAAPWALPIRDAGVGYAYVTSQMGTRLTGDPRDVALRDALYSAIAAAPGKPRRVA